MSIPTTAQIWEQFVDDLLNTPEAKAGFAALDRKIDELTAQHTERHNQP
jgi:hypothetical protein